MMQGEESIGQEEEPSGEARNPIPGAAVVETDWEVPAGPAIPVISPAASAAAGDETVTLALLNGLDVSSLPTKRDSTTVAIPWPLANLEGMTLEWRRKAAQALTFLLAGCEGLHR